MEGITVLSLFDGISCGRVALERAGIEVKKYYASEIDKHAIKVTGDNWKETIQLGDVTKISYKDGILHTENGEFRVGKIDLLISGSPCQSISNLGNGLGLNGKSGLFYHWLRLKDEIKPEYWLLENVVGKKEAINEISNLLGTSPNMINSNLLSAQNRKRLYWCSVGKLTPPNPKNVNLKDILEDGLPEDSKLTDSRKKWLLSESGQKCVNKKYATIDPIKASCLTARSDSSWNSNYVYRGDELTRLTPIEYERLQTLPDNYTVCISAPNRYKSIGNAWTVDIISHIFNCMFN